MRNQQLSASFDVGCAWTVQLYWRHVLCETLLTSSSFDVVRLHRGHSFFSMLISMVSLNIVWDPLQALLYSRRPLYDGGPSFVESINSSFADYQKMNHVLGDALQNRIIQISEDRPLSAMLP